MKQGRQKTGVLVLGMRTHSMQGSTGEGWGLQPRKHPHLQDRQFGRVSNSRKPAQPHGDLTVFISHVLKQEIK